MEWGGGERSRSIDKIFYWVCVRIRQNHLHIVWEEAQKNLADDVTNYLQTVTGRGCAGTTNLGLARKTDNPLKGIRNPVL